MALMTGTCCEAGNTEDDSGGYDDEDAYNGDGDNDEDGDEDGDNNNGGGDGSNHNAGRKCR